MSKKSTLIVAAAIAVLGLSSQAFAQSFSAGNGAGYDWPSRYGSNSGRHAGIGHDVLATASVTTGQTDAAACSDQIAGLRQAALVNHQPTPETVWQAHSYAQLMFAADLALAEAKDEVGNKDECLLAARRANDELQRTLTAAKN